MDNQNPPIQETPPSQVYTAPHPATPPPSPKSFLSNKIILIIVILLILFGAGGTYLTLNSKPKPAPIVSKEVPTSTPTPTDETTTWKTYTNKDYSFSLKYPSEFQYINENPNNSVLILNENFKAAQISFSNSNSGLSSSIIFWSTNQQKAIENLNKLIADNSYKKVIVDGSHGVYMEIKATGSTDQPSIHWYYFGRDGKVIAVQGNYVEVKKIEQILSTFKFTN